MQEIHGLRFLRASVTRKDTAAGALYFHGRIEPDRADFDFIFAPIYAAYAGKYLLVEKYALEQSELESPTITWSSDDGYDHVLPATELARLGPRMPEFNDCEIPVFDSPPPRTRTWRDRPGFERESRRGKRAPQWPAGVHALFRNVDGLWWELFSIDPADIATLRERNRGRPTLTLLTVDFFGRSEPQPVL
jgi:hypothetical protein